MKLGWSRAIAFPLLSLVAIACMKEDPPPPVVQVPPPPPVVLPPAPPLPPTPAGLPELSVAPESAPTPEKVAWGKQLFFDPRLSKDGSASCATCHVHEKGWTDGLALSTKVGGAVNTRHTPSLYNVGYHATFYWDGRAPTLEKQIEAAWKGQMGADPEEAAAVIAKVPVYKARCEQLCGKPPTAKDIVDALASFVRTLRSGGSAWDRYEKGDTAAVSADVLAGYAIFTKKANCALCHAPPLYTDLMFHNVGIGADKPEPDPGRGKVTGDPKDQGAFKTPGLRSASKTAPYFHDGSEPTLEGAVRRMVAGGDKIPNLDPKLKPAKLSAKEMLQLVAFVQALDSSESFEAPELPRP